MNRKMKKKTRRKETKETKTKKGNKKRYDKLSFWWKCFGVRKMDSKESGVSRMNTLVDDRTVKTRDNESDEVSKIKE